MKRFVFILGLLLPFLLEAQTERGLTPFLSVNNQSAKATRALIIGISDYRDPEIPDLQYADRDARAFAYYLTTKPGGRVPEENIHLLLNEKATQANFAMQLDTLYQESEEGDKVMIFFAGHGDVEVSTDVGYLLCHDAPSRVYASGGALDIGILKTYAERLINNKKAKVVLITDACRSGNLAGSEQGPKATTAKMAELFSNGIKFLSCQPSEFSIEGEQWGGGRGVFTYYLLEGMYGLADENGDETVTLMELENYLEDHVPQQVSPKSQIPLAKGDKSAMISPVYPEFLRNFEPGGPIDQPLFPMEDPVEERVDTDENDPARQTELLNGFMAALESKRFLEPAGDNASELFDQIVKNNYFPAFQPVLRKEFATKIQDEVQAVMNSWLKMDASILGSSRNHRLDQYKHYPAYIDKALDLMGEDAIMGPTLQAKKAFFEGYLIAHSDTLSGRKKSRMALRKFRQSLDFQPNMPQTLLQVGLIYGNGLGQIDSMEFYAAQAARFAPTWALPYSSLSTFFRKVENDTLKSWEYLEKAMTLDSTSALIWWTVGDWYLQQREFEQARKAFVRAQAKDPSVGIFELGLVDYTTGHPQAARERFRKAIELDSVDFAPRYYLGLIAQSEGNPEEAEKHFNKAIQLASQATFLYNDLANLYQSSFDRYEEAEANIMKAIEMDGDYPAAFYNLWNLYKAIRRYDDAESAYRKAVKLEDKEPSPYQLACLKARQGKIDRAFELLEESLKQKEYDYDLIQNDPDLESLRERKPKWHRLMKDYFPDQS